MPDRGNAGRTSDYGVGAATAAMFLFCRVLLKLVVHTLAFFKFYISVFFFVLDVMTV